MTKKILSHLNFYTMNSTLETNPKLGVLALDELLDVMKFHADDDSLRRVKRDAKEYLKVFSPNDDDYDKKSWELRCNVMKSYLEFVRHCYKKEIKSCKKTLEFLEQKTPTKELENPGIKE